MTKNKLLLTSIVLFGLFIRAYHFAVVPPSLNWDEVSHGYNAYSILRTGKDEWGISFPTIFRAYGDYKLPLYIYLSAIPIYFFGLTSFAVRLVSLISGVIAIPLIYLLVRTLFPRKPSMGFIAAFLLAICPWHFFISRPALEANLALTLIIGGFYLLTKSVSRQSVLFGSVLLLSFSLHSYNTARIFTPLLFLAFYYLYRPRYIWNINLVSSIIVGSLSFGLVVWQTITGTALARYDKLAIITPQSTYQIGQNRLSSSLHPLLARLIYNRPIYIAKSVTQNYLGYFSPKFFWQKSGPQTQFAIPGQNLFGLPIFLLFFVGLIASFWHRKQFIFLYLWLLLSPLAASLTASPLQALRPNPLIPAVIIFAAYGVSILPIYLKVISLGACVIGFSTYLHIYFYQYSPSYSSSWQYGYQEAIGYLTQNESRYSHIFFTKRYGEPHLFYAFFSQLDPTILQDQTKTIRFAQSNWYWTDRINNVYFVNDWAIPNGAYADKIKLESGGIINTEHSLLITSPDHIPLNAAIIKEITNPVNDPVFVIAEFK